MIFSPKVGLHENVAVLDFNDEFANIIVNNNISYEIGNATTQHRLTTWHITKYSKRTFRIGVFILNN